MSTNTITAAAVRLTLSRTHLRQALHTHTDTAPAAWLWGQYAAPVWMARLKESPEVQALWEKAKTQFQTHPLGWTLGAVAAVGVLAWSRPWRWIFQPAVVASLLPYLVRSVSARAPPPPT